MAAEENNSHPLEKIRQCNHCGKEVKVSGLLATTPSFFCHPCFMKYYCQLKISDINPLWEDFDNFMTYNNKSP